MTTQIIGQIMIEANVENIMAMNAIAYVIGAVVLGYIGYCIYKALFDPWD